MWTLYTVVLARGERERRAEQVKKYDKGPQALRLGPLRFSIKQLWAVTNYPGTTSCLNSCDGTLSGSVTGTSLSLIPKASATPLP